MNIFSQIIPNPIPDQLPENKNEKKSVVNFCRNIMNNGW